MRAHVHVSAEGIKDVVWTEGCILVLYSGLRPETPKAMFKKETVKWQLHTFYLLTSLIEFLL